MNARALALVVLGGLAAAGCSGNEGPVAGELVVQLASPNGDDRAVLFRLGGAQSAVSAPSGSGYRVLVSPEAVGDTVRVLVIAPQGARLMAGSLVRVLVPDTRQVSAYSARVVDVASVSYAQRAAGGYVLTVVSP